jgi:hypothetical protein
MNWRSGNQRTRPKPNKDTGGEFIGGVWRRRLTT